MIAKLTLKKLIQLLANMRGMEVWDILLHTYKHYTTSIELMKLLILRFAIPVPRNISPF